jgi:UDP-N-acetylmuramate--alanine ligase
VEADEFGRAFLNYAPLVSIVTNIDREHLDTYRNISGVKNAFLKFLSNTRSGGALILNRDDKNLHSLQPRISRIAKRKKLKVVWHSLKDRSNAALVCKNIQIPGEHNVSNALAVLALANVLGIQKKISLSAIGSYRGSWRRMEYKGECRMSNVECRVYDDYAHHPTEIKATLKALREKYPKSALVCVFQPHQRERLRLLFKEFRSAFDDAHITLILPLYRVAGREKTATGPDSEALVKAIQQATPGKMLFYLEKPENLKKALTVLIAGIDTSKNAKQCPFPGAKFYPLKSLPAGRQVPSVIIVMMGAGDIFTHTPLLLG